MITESLLPLRFPLRGTVLALAAWFGGVALLTLVVDPERAVVMGPAAIIAAAVEDAGARPVASGRGFVIVRTMGTETVRRLYRAGAWFVWPAVRGGCAE